MPKFHSIARRPHRSPQQRGFSLVEMIAVLVLIALALTAVSVSVSKSLSSARVKAASRDLVAALRYTRGQAIVKREEKALELNLDEKSYLAPGRPKVELPHNMDLKLLTAAEEQTGEASGRIRFFPDGSSTGGHISVLAGDREWRINVAWLTGEVAMEELQD